MSEDHCFLTVIGGVILVVLEIVATNYAFTVKANEKDIQSYTFLFRNWGQNLIEDIIISNTTTCPESYKLYSYGESFEVKHNCNPKTCEYTIPSKLLYSWRNSYFCIKYMNFNYNSLMNSKLITSYYGCIENYRKICGLIDTLNNYLCLGLNDKCPINYIQITSKNTTYNSTLYKKQDFFDNESSLLISNKRYDSLIPVGIQLFTNRPCAYINDIGLPNYVSRRSLPNYELFNDCSNVIFNNGYNYDMNIHYKYLDISDFSSIDSYNNLYLMNNTIYPKSLYELKDLKLYKVPYFGKNLLSVCSLNSTGINFDEILETDVSKMLQLNFGICILLISLCVLKFLIVIQILTCRFFLCDFLFYFIFSLPLLVLTWIFYNKINTVLALVKLKNIVSCYDMFTAYNINIFMGRSLQIVNSAGTVAILTSIIFGGSFLFLLVVMIIKCDD